MPRAKREKIVSLTQTKKKTKESKTNFIGQIRDALENYDRLYVIEYDNLKSSEFIQIRQKFKDNSQFFMGKKTVMSVALGRTKEEEIADDLHAVSQYLLSGEKRGLFFTNQTHASVLKKREQFMVNLLAYWTKKKGFHEL